MWSSWWTKWHRVWSSPSTSVSTVIILPTVPHSSIVIIWDWYNRPNSGRHTKRAQSHPILQMKKNTNVLLAPWYEEVREWGYSCAHSSTLWVVSFTTQPLYPRGNVAGTHFTVGWVGSRISLTQWQRECPCPYREPNRQPIVSHCIDWAIPDHQCCEVRNIIDSNMRNSSFSDHTCLPYLVF
jgi:hypothetical protein